MVGRPAAVGHAVVGRPAVKNYLFLVYSTITNIRDKFPARRGGGHSTAPLTGPLGRKSTLTGKAPCGGGDASGGPFPFKNGPYRQTALRGRPPYGKALRGGFLLEGPLRITGKLTGSYGEGLYQNWAGISACVL